MMNTREPRPNMPFRIHVGRLAATTTYRRPRSCSLYTSPSTGPKRKLFAHCYPFGFLLLSAGKKEEPKGGQAEDFVHKL